MLVTLIRYGLYRLLLELIRQNVFCLRIRRLECLGYNKASATPLDGRYVNRSRRQIQIFIAHQARRVIRGLQSNFGRLVNHYKLIVLQVLDDILRHGQTLLRIFHLPLALELFHITGAARLSLIIMSAMLHEHEVDLAEASVGLRLALLLKHLSGIYFGQRRDPGRRLLTLLNLVLDGLELVRVQTRPYMHFMHLLVSVAGRDGDERVHKLVAATAKIRHLGHQAAGQQLRVRRNILSFTLRLKLIWLRLQIAFLIFVLHEWRTVRCARRQTSIFHR